MVFAKILQAFILFTFLKANICATEVQKCDIPCDASDQKEAVCTFDTDAGCFRILPSKCNMELMNCIFQLDYKIYNDDYCEIEKLKCNDNPFVQSPPEHEGSAEDSDNSLSSAENLNEVVSN